MGLVRRTVPNDPEQEGLLRLSIAALISERRDHLLGLLVVGVVLGIHVRTYWFLTDDAYISFRYARNFAQGHGLVFNVGAPPVEGYTNFLWVVVLGGLARLGARPEVTAPILGVLSTALLWLGAVVAGRCC